MIMYTLTVEENYSKKGYWRATIILNKRDKLYSIIFDKFRNSKNQHTLVDGWNKFTNRRNLYNSKYPNIVKKCIYYHLTNLDDIDDGIDDFRECFHEHSILQPNLDILYSRGIHILISNGIDKLLTNKNLVNIIVEYFKDDLYSIRVDPGL